MTNAQLFEYLLPHEFEISDEVIKTVAPKIGPRLLEDGEIESYQLQYFEGEIDWVATLNDILSFTPSDECERWYDMMSKK